MLTVDPSRQGLRTIDYVPNGTMTIIDACQSRFYGFSSLTITVDG